MKKLEIIIRPEKLEELKTILTESGVTGMMISNIMGFGNQKGYTHQYRGTTYAVNLVSKLRVETVVKDELVESLTIKQIKGLSKCVVLVRLLKTQNFKYEIAFEDSNVEFCFEKILKVEEI